MVNLQMSSPTASEVRVCAVTPSAPFGTDLWHVLPKTLACK